MVRSEFYSVLTMPRCRDAGQRDDWRRDAEGYILQWMDGASV